MTPKEILHRRIDELSDEDAAELLAELEWQETDEEVLTPEEWESVREGERQIAAGETVSGEELFRELGIELRG